LIFCILAKVVVPDDWDWQVFLREARHHIPFAFEKSDARKRWGSKNVFQAQMGGRSSPKKKKNLRKKDPRNNNKI